MYVVIRAPIVIYHAVAFLIPAERLCDLDPMTGRVLGRIRVVPRLGFPTHRGLPSRASTPTHAALHSVSPTQSEHSQPHGLRHISRRRRRPCTFGRWPPFRSLAARKGVSLALEDPRGSSRRVTFRIEGRRCAVGVEIDETPSRRRVVIVFFLLLKSKSCSRSLRSAPSAKRPG
jgi:hypothetical protein